MFDPCRVRRTFPISGVSPLHRGTSWQSIAKWRGCSFAVNGRLPWRTQMHLNEDVLMALQRIATVTTAVEIRGS